MRKKRLAAVGWPILVCAYLALAVSPVSARVLQSGFGYNNYNFSPVTVTYSWSGHYPGEPDV